MLGDCTEAEIKGGQSPFAHGHLLPLFTLTLRSSGVCLLIRRYNPPPTRQLFHDAPINLPEKSFKGSVESVKTVSGLNVP